MESVISVDGLVKRFGEFAALDELNLEVVRGEVHGFLGPNGSGKSTTIRVLLGLLRADRGTVRLLGGDPWRDVVALHRRLAYVPGDVSLWPSLTGGEAIDLLGKLRGGLDETRRSDLIERFELDPKKRGRSYSKGNRQKVAIIAALASDVELLILDEPTSGLDPLMEDVFQKEIKDEKAKGRSIFLSSHALSEVEALADRVSIIRAGQVVQTGTLDDLRHHTQTSVTARLGRVPENLSTMPGVSNLRVDGDRVALSVDTDALGPVMSQLSLGGIRALEAAPPSLEDYFLQLYSDGSASRGAAR